MTFLFLEKMKKASKGKGLLAVLLANLEELVENVQMQSNLSESDHEIDDRTNCPLMVRKENINVINYGA